MNKTLPSNIEVEKYILGCLMIDKADYIGKLNEADFHNSTCRDIYKAIKHLSDKKQIIDIISISDLLSKKYENSLEIAIDIERHVPTTASFEAHLKDLKGYTLRREIINRAYEVQEMVYASEFESPIDLKNNVLQKLDIDIYEPKKNNFDIKNIVVECFNNIEKRRTNKDEEKLYTGFYDLDKLTAGLHPEEMTIIAARPGIGKTAFVLQLQLNLAAKGTHCLMFSREMSTSQIGERLISNMSGVDSQSIRFAKNLTDKEWEKMGLASGEVYELPIVINDEAVNVQEMRACCRELKSKGKLDVVVIDYLQLCRTLKKTQTREREIAEISWELKLMSKEFKVPVIVLSQ